MHTYLSEALTLDFYPAEDPQAKCLLYWNTLSLPIAKDQKVGELHLVSSEGAILKNVPLLATEVIHYAWPYSWLQMSWMMILFAGILGNRIFMGHCEICKASKLLTQVLKLMHFPKIFPMIQKLPASLMDFLQ